MNRVSSQYLKPSISIAIPTYNEAEHIASVLRSFLASDYDNIVEILVADGGSQDDTRAIVEQLSLEDRRIKLIHNPYKIQATALNLALEQSKGEIFLRADAHCDYAPDYVEQCIRALQQSQAINVGGAQRFVATNHVQAGISLASKSFLGSGGAKYRNPEYNGFAETVFLGCFWRKYLADISGYNPSSTPNEDAELNLRLTNLEPKAIYISSQIKAWYYPRKTWGGLFQQYFKYGKSRYQTFRKHPQKSQLRGKLPFIALIILISILVWDLSFIEIDLPLKGLLSAIAAIPFIESLRLNWQYKKSFTREIWRGKLTQKPSFLLRWLQCGIAIFTMNLAHALGYGYQLLNYRCQWLLSFIYTPSAKKITQALDSRS